MALQDEQDEKIISAVMNLLQEKHDQEPEDQYTHYVVINDDGNGDGSFEEFCENCIESAVTESLKRWVDDKENTGKETPLFHYEYSQGESETNCRICDNCGKHLAVCVTADQQEIDHWKNDFEETDFIIKNMDTHTAYELYEVMQFIHQAREDVYKIGVTLAEKILKINQGESPSTCDATDAQ